MKNQPRGNDEFHAFTVDDVIYPTLQDARKFCKSVITDGESLVHLRNQLTFLLADLYGERHSSHFDSPFERSTVFWAWIFFPSFPQSSGQPSVDSHIVSHDLVYIKRDLSDKEIKKVQSTMRQLNLAVFARRVHEPKSICTSVLLTRTE